MVRNTHRWDLGGGGGGGGSGGTLQYLCVFTIWKIRDLYLGDFSLCVIMQILQLEENVRECKLWM